MYLEIILDESVETMAVDGVHLFVAPSFLPKITEAELRGILVHEILHCAFLHHVRRGERDPELWNEAADYVINPTVIESGFKLPAGALLEGRFKGMGAEEVYSLLKAKAKQQPQRGKAGQGQPGQAPGQPQAGPTAPGQAPGQGVGQAQPPTQPQAPTVAPGAAQQGPQGQQGQGAGQGSPTPGQAGAGPRGSPGQAGQAQPGQGPSRPLGQAGRVLDAAPNYQPAKIAEQTAEWQRRVRQAVSIARGQNAGNTPGNFIDLVEAVNQPRTDLYEELHRFVDSKIRTDYSWTNPNKRMLYTGFVMPGIRADGISKLGMVIDTSGSMNQTALDTVLGVIQAIMDLGNVEEVVIIQCDTKVHKVDRFKQGDDIKIEAYGRGGTNFAPALKWFEENEPDVALLIYFTDLECDSWGHEPGVPLMWTGYGSKSRLEARAKNIPFGEFVRVEEAA